MFEQWYLMEKFYYDDLGTIVAIFIILSILSISTLSHLRHLFPKIVNGLFLVFLLLAGSFIFQNYQMHGDLMTRAKHVNPAIRDFKKNFYRDQIYTNYEKELYRNDYMGNYFKAIGLYRERELVEEVTFLGRDSFNYLYFKINDKVYWTSEKWVEFSDQTSETSRAGVQYELLDLQLVELGFVAKSRVFFQHFIVPTSLETLDYQTTPNVKALQHRGIVSKWVSPS